MSVVTPKYLFVHVPKTGGMWTTDILLRYAGGKKNGDAMYHRPKGDLPHGDGRLSLSNVRDPWSWYASWYLHSRDQRNPWLQEYGRGSLAFKDVLFGVTHPDKVNPRKLGGYWPDPYFDEVQIWKARNLGLCTYAFDYMWGGAVDISIPTDRLREGMSVLLDRDLSQEPFRNAHREHSNYRQFYTDEMIRWVKDADRSLIFQYGFEPFRPTPKCIYGQVEEPRKSWWRRALELLK